MSTYRVAEGTGHTLGDLVVLVQQPSSDLIAPVERNYSASGANHNQGKYAVWHFDHFDGVTDYITVLSQFGLDDQYFNTVTIYTRDEWGTWRMYTGIAHLPEPKADIKQQNFYLRDIDIYITDLVQL